MADRFVPATAITTNIRDAAPKLKLRCDRFLRAHVAFHVAWSCRHSEKTVENQWYSLGDKKAPRKGAFPHISLFLLGFSWQQAAEIG